MAKKIVISVAVLAMVCGFYALAIAGSGPETIVFENTKKENVSFAHHAHQASFECAECHHTKNADGTQGPYVAGEEKKCATCHELGSMKDNVHVNCRGCHQEKENADPAMKEKGLSKCGNCHKK